MTITLGWWLVPAALWIGYIVFGIMHCKRSSIMDLRAGLASGACLVAALSMTVGHYL